MGETIQSIYDSIVQGSQSGTVRGVQAGLESGIDPLTILYEGMVAAMGEVSRLFDNGEYYVPEMLVSARAMKAGLALLKPRLVQGDYRPVAKVAIGTVKGDQHDIGKNLVALMLEGAAFEIVDLGSDVPPGKFVEAVRTQDVQIVALSALLTTTMPNMQAVVEALEQSGYRSQVKVIVGGAPLNQAFSDHIRADGYASDATQAVALAKRLVAANTPIQE